MIPTLGIACAIVITCSACADPGRAALERLVRGTDALIVLAERRARGELDGPALNAALVAWERTERIEIETLSADASRALGADLRAALAERWRSAAERLSKRLSAVKVEIESPR